jgi:N-acetylmuramoyl-L-alanine amidase
MKMREIKFIILHCTAGSAQHKTSDIIAYWKQKLGWSRYGYHKLVDADGKVEHLTTDAEITNGVKGYNQHSIHICYKGGWNGTDTRTDAQKNTLRNLVIQYKKKYPKAKVVGHRDCSPDLNGDGKITPNEFVKKCPCFDAMEEYKGI